MPNPFKKTAPGSKISGQPNYRMTKSVRSSPSEYMDKSEFDEMSERMRYAQEAKRSRTTPPSSQVKKTKMSDRKLSKMGAGINTGLTAQRTKILKAIQRLPAAQQRKIYEALEGYAMD